MTACADTKAKRALQALFRGELDAEGYTWLRSHAASCADCREAYDRLARAGAEGRAAAPVRAPRPTERPSFFRPWMGISMGLATAAALALLVVMPEKGADTRDNENEWGVRSAQGTAWGVRAFCIGADGQVRGEARPGGTLACSEGGSVQFSYTAPEPARLTIETTSPSGEPLRFFPSDGPPAEVAPGVDVTLPFSTPVQGGWLSGPLEVRARFTDARGQTLGETRVMLTPR